MMQAGCVLLFNYEYIQLFFRLADELRLMQRYKEDADYYRKQWKEENDLRIHVEEKVYLVI